MKSRVVLYGENDVPLSTLGENPQDKAKQVWDVVTELLALQTGEIVRVESVEVWDDADTPQEERSEK